jgi:chaperonin GroES
MAAWFQKNRIFRMRESLGISRNSYLSVWNNGIELQFYFYPVDDAPILPQAIDTGTELNILVGTMSTIKPIADRVFLEPMEEDRMTKSGIVLPDSAEKERPIKGRVIALGAGKRNDRGDVMHMSVKVGDVVLFKKYGPDEIELEGKKYLVAEESDILAILEN